MTHHETLQSISIQPLRYFQDLTWPSSYTYPVILVAACPKRFVKNWSRPDIPFQPVLDVCRIDNINLWNTMGTQGSPSLNQPARLPATVPPATAIAVFACSVAKLA